MAFVRARIPPDRTSEGMNDIGGMTRPSARRQRAKLSAPIGRLVATSTIG
jgi:hypothetical protein